MHAEITANYVHQNITNRQVADQHFGTQRSASQKIVAEILSFMTTVFLRMCGTVSSNFVGLLLQSFVEENTA
ncbi:hypothetical protein [Ferruginibacter sp.]